MTDICGSWPSRWSHNCLICSLCFTAGSLHLIDNWPLEAILQLPDWQSTLALHYLHDKFRVTHNPFSGIRWVCHVFLFTQCIDPAPSLDSPCDQSLPDSSVMIPPFGSDVRIRDWSVLSQTSHITLICHARSIAKAHMHPCACKHGPRRGSCPVTLCLI